jgi:GTPase SAR1 family protein
MASNLMYFLSCALKEEGHTTDSDFERIQDKIVDFPNIMSEVAGFIRTEIRVALIGPSCGKTSLITRLKTGNFERQWLQTDKITTHAVDSADYGLTVIFYDFSGTLWREDYSPLKDVDHVVFMMGAQKSDREVLNGMKRRAKPWFSKQTKQTVAVTCCDVSSNKNLDIKGTIKMSSKTSNGLDGIMKEIFA